MSKELKPCPFCGGEAKCGQINIGLFRAGCINVQSCSVFPRSTGNSRKEAIKAWNNRPSPWHTGTIPEDGDYVCTVKIYPRHESDYAPFLQNNLFYFKDGSITNCLIGEKFEIVRWQKIEPYKGN